MGSKPNRTQLGCGFFIGWFTLIKLKSNQNAFDQRLAKELGRDLPFALARGLTWTLKDVKKNHPKWAKRAFDNPVKWTLNAMALNSVTKTASGKVFFKDQARRGGKGVPAGKYLLPNIRGGRRVHNRWERSLIAKHIMLRSEYAMPTEFVTDRNGNVMRKYYAEIIAQLRIGNDGIGNATDRQMANRRKRNVERIFVANKQDASLPRGIWQRDFESGEISPLFIFVTSVPTYTKRFPWKSWAAKTMKERAPSNIRRSANMILRKANR